MHTLDELIAAGYSIQNAKITSVSLNMEDYGCLTLAMTMESGGWGVVYGGYCLGKGYLGAEEFEGSAKGMEAIMRIMNTVGVSDLLKMKDKYVRVATKGWDSTVKIIGNIINDIWFDYEAFFKENGGGAMRAKIIAVDFDGTLIEEGKWPGIGATNEKVLNYCKDEQAKGTRIILWTNRVGEPLETAIRWCEEHGLRLDAVNDNVPEAVEFFGTNTRKIYADEFIDDRMAQGFNLPYYGEPQIKELTDKELISLYREKYFDVRDPIMNYWLHETIPHTIVVEHHSGFERTFNVFEYPAGKRDQ